MNNPQRIKKFWDLRIVVLLAIFVTSKNIFSAKQIRLNADKEVYKTME